MLPKSSKWAIAYTVQNMSALYRKNTCTGLEVEQTVPMSAAGSVSNMGM